MYYIDTNFRVRNYSKAGVRLYDSQHYRHPPVLQGGEIRQLHVQVVFTGERDRRVNAHRSNATTTTANGALARSPPGPGGSTPQWAPRSGVHCGGSGEGPLKQPDG